MVSNNDVVPNFISEQQPVEVKENIVQPVDILNNSTVVNETQQLVDINPTLANDVIIDYKAKFFEEQEKNKELETQIKELNEKLSNIKSILD